MEEFENFIVFPKKKKRKDLELKYAVEKVLRMTLVQVKKRTRCLLASQPMRKKPEGHLRNLKATFPGPGSQGHHYLMTSQGTLSKLTQEHHVQAVKNYRAVAMFQAGVDATHAGSRP